MFFFFVFFYPIRARRSAGKMNTSVSALLDECAGYGEGESEIPEEDEFLTEDSTKGIMIIVVYFDGNFFLFKSY